MTTTSQGTDGPNCPDCGKEMSCTVSQIPMWMGAELKLIENVPVHLCALCRKEMFEPHIEDAIRALVATGFPDSFAAREVTLPVFDLKKYIDPDMKTMKKKEDAA